MLHVGRQTQRTCQTRDRRAFVQVGGSSVLGLSLAGLLRGKDGFGKTPGSAKSVVLLWLWGGPSQLDTFDPKPKAPLEFRGPFGTIPTKVAGVRFCELFPKLAGISDKFAVLRTLHTQSNDHGVAATIGLTGNAAGGTGLDGKPLPGTPQPAMGAVVSKAMAKARSDSGLPPFLVVGGKLHQGKKPIVGEGGGKLGALYDPFRMEYDPATGTKVPALELPSEVTPERLMDRLALQGAFDKSERLLDSASMDGYRRRAFEMLTSAKSRLAFDLAQETEATVRRYGKTRFGQSCLLARRLVESGVPFVQVNWSDHVEAEEDSGDGGWDHHYRNFQIMQDRHAAWLDRTVSAFLVDLDERGLLKTTLVIAVGEFGRTPKINDKAGREHHPDCYSALVAGGGVVGGRVIGTSDARAEKPADTPLTPGDLCATVHHAIGLTSEQIAGMGLTASGRVIEELF